jgi:hypothetical protein
MLTVRIFLGHFELCFEVRRNEARWWTGRPRHLVIGLWVYFAGTLS